MDPDDASEDSELVRSTLAGLDGITKLREALDALEGLSDNPLQPQERRRWTDALNDLPREDALRMLSLSRRLRGRP